MKYKLGALLLIAYLTEIQILSIHVKDIESDFQLKSKMLVHGFNLDTYWAKCETRSIFQSWKRSAQILGPIKMYVICSNSSLFSLFQIGLF